MKPRQLTNQELADLSDEWGNPTVDTTKYYQTATVAYEVDKETFEKLKADGYLFQIHEGRYIVGA